LGLRFDKGPDGAGQFLIIGLGVGDDEVVRVVDGLEEDI